MTASANASFNVAGNAAAVALTPLVNFSTLTSPVAAGQPLYAIVVTPSTWVGTFSLSGANAADFVIVGSNVVVGSTPLTNGSYAVTVTATP